MSVQTGTATHSDCSFLSGAVEASRCVTGQDVEEVFADGAYQSPDNLEFAQGEGITLKTGKMQGGCRYILNLKEAADELMVTDTTTGEAQKAIYMGHAPKPDKTGRKWRRWKIPFRHKDGVQSWRYFPEDEIRRSELRQKILTEDPKELAKRNNVEAAMFQYSFHTRNGKTRYRRLWKHRVQAYHRCMWMEPPEDSCLHRRPHFNPCFVHYGSRGKHEMVIHRNFTKNHQRLIFTRLASERLQRTPLHGVGT